MSSNKREDDLMDLIGPACFIYLAHKNPKYLAKSFKDAAKTSSVLLMLACVGCILFTLAATGLIAYVVAFILLVLGAYAIRALAKVWLKRKDLIRIGLTEAEQSNLQAILVFLGIVFGGSSIYAVYFVCTM